MHCHAHSSELATGRAVDKSQLIFTAAQRRPRRVPRRLMAVHGFPRRRQRILPVQNTNRLQRDFITQPRLSQAEELFLRKADAATIQMYLNVVSSCT